MVKYSGPEEIYSILVEESEDSWLFGLVAFAVIEEQKIEWMHHQRKTTGALPSATEVENWYQNQPEGVLLRAKDTAELRLNDYSSEILEQVSEAQRQEMQESLLMAELKEIKKFGPQFIVNFAGGMASTFVFTLLIAIMAFIVFNDSSPVEIFSELTPPTEESNND